MATNTDIQEYPSYDTKGKVVKTSTVGGKEGKQIKITEVSLKIASEKSNVKASVMISVNGVDYAGWSDDNTDYGDVRVYNRYPFEVDAGKDAVLTWTLTTENKKYPAKIKQASYTFEYVDVETPIVETPVVEEPAGDATEDKGPLVVIECESTAKAEAAVEDIKSKGILTDDTKIYIAKSV